MSKLDRYTRRRWALAEKLKEKLAQKGLTAPRVIQAISEVPRHLFIDQDFWHLAYEDKALRIRAQQTISQPFIVAYQTALLDIQPGEKVLEIGTGSGFQAGILSKVGAKVYTIERIEELHTLVQERFKMLDKQGYSYPINLRFGDGFKGWAEEAPFDKIIITAAAPAVPTDLGSQLKVGGVMVVPVGEPEQIQQLLYVVRKDAHTLSPKNLGNVQFVPMLDGTD